MREQAQVTMVLTEIRKLLPFTLLGFDTDNDSVFMNETVRDYCAAEAISFTRCRPYRKNDQAWVEQKNGSIVRRIVGYRRFEGLVAATALANLYGTVRLFVNFFQPSFKQAEKRREGARIHKRYHKPATPCQRLARYLVALAYRHNDFLLPRNQTAKPDLHKSAGETPPSLDRSLAGLAIARSPPPAPWPDQRLG